MSFKLSFDHLVVTARTLDEGTSYVEAVLGTKLSKGGKHVKMGTHNRLLSLGDNAYLEVIAIDPDAPKPAQRRWFNLDTFSGAPRLMNWVCNTDDIEAALEAAPSGTGTPLALMRGDLKWQMAVPEFGRLPFDDAMPALIEWHSDTRPPQMLDDVGFRMTRLDVFHPNADDLIAGFPALNALHGFVSVLPGPEKRLIATISTPAGDRVLA